jgi:hypothetical protein
MRKFQLLLLLIPFTGMSQTKNVVSSFRVFPKVDKASAFEKAFIAHAQKFHTGDWKWKVYEIQSGPDANGFHVIEGPLSWETFDKRANLGAAHTADWNNNVMPNASERGTATYSEFVEDMSTVQLTDYADKIVLNHLCPKPGMVVALEEMIKKMKSTWTAGNESVAVYRSVASGDPEMVYVTRLKGGLKELDASFRKPMSERYNAANGANSWTDFLKDYGNIVEKRWSELLFLRPDLSSK